MCYVSVIVAQSVLDQLIRAGFSDHADLPPVVEGAGSILVSLVHKPSIKGKHTAAKKKDEASFCTAVRQMLVREVLPNSCVG